MKKSLKIISAEIFFSAVLLTIPAKEIRAEDKCEIFLPTVLREQENGNGSKIYVHNNSHQETLVEIYCLYDSGSNHYELSIAPNATRAITPSFPGADSWGSMVLTANQNISAVVHTWYRSEELSANAISAGISKNESGSEVYLPSLMQNAFGGYYTHLYVQNTSLSHQFHKIEPRFASYRGSARGSSKIALPVQFNSGFGLWSSSFSVQNTGTDSSPLNIALLREPGLSYLPEKCEAVFPADGFSSFSTFSDYLPGSAIPGQGGCVPDPIERGWGGSTILTAEAPIWAVINEVPDPPTVQSGPNRGKVLYGFRSLPGVSLESSEKVVILPFMPKKYPVWEGNVSASFTVQNMENEDTTIYLTIYDQNGGLVSNKCEAWGSDNKLLANQVKRCYFGSEPDDNLLPGELYSLVITSTKTKVGAIGHVIDPNEGTQITGDWEMAYLGEAVPERAYPNQGKLWMGIPHNYYQSDSLNLFTYLDEWETARSFTSVLQFYAGFIHPDYNQVGAPTNEELEQAIRRIKFWGNDIAIEGPAVKAAWGECDWQVSADVNDVVLERIESVGGEVVYLRMDEPLMSTTAPSPSSDHGCGYTMEEAADQTAAFLTHFKSLHPDVVVGEVEPWPRFNKSDIIDWVEMVKNRTEYYPSFFHLDINLEIARRQRTNLREVHELQQFFSSRNIAFGVVIWDSHYYYEGSAQSDKKFNEGAMASAALFHSIAPLNEVIVQTWCPYPENTLPEDGEYTFTRLVRDYALKHTPGVLPPKIGDFNHDNSVNNSDLKILLSKHNTDNPRTDFNFDRTVNGLDFGKMLKLIQ